MTCREREQAIALYAGGDLPETAELERHVAECAECREAVESVRAAMQLAREAHAEPIAPAHYAAVRARVLAELAREPRLSWWGRLSTCGRLPIGQRLGRANNPPQVGNVPHSARRAWALVATAAAAAFIMLLFPAKVKTPEVVRQAARPVVGDPSQGGAGLSLPAPARPRSGARLATLRRGAGRLKPAPPYLQARQPATADPAALQVAAAEPEASEPLVIKLLTDDPNVVIYWIAESKGD